MSYGEVQPGEFLAPLARVGRCLPVNIPADRQVCPGCWRALPVEEFAPCQPRARAHCRSVAFCAACRWNGMAEQWCRRAEQADRLLDVVAAEHARRYRRRFDPRDYCSTCGRHLLHQDRKVGRCADRAGCDDVASLRASDLKQAA